ncbi:MAG: hypothetical protein Q4B28_03520 [bacterium]|nr:hypothetical protein [bacterium]
MIGLSDELSAEDKSSVEGNSAVPSLLLTTDTSIASVINLATKKADELCRNKWID